MNEKATDIESTNKAIVTVKKGFQAFNRFDTAVESVIVTSGIDSESSRCKL